MADISYEVDEQLRSARLKAMFRKSWPYAVAVAVVALVAALVIWGLQQYRADRAAKASIAYAQAVQALGVGDLRLARQRFDAVAATGTPAYGVLARMQEAGISLRAGDTAAAAASEDQAAKLAPSPALADAASLEAAYLVMDTAPYAQVYARLQPLTAVGRPYRGLAREALAIARLAAGHTVEAKGDFQVLALSQDSSEGARNRANAALALLKSGTAGGLAAIAKGAIGLTPAPPPQALPPGLTAPSPSDQQTAPAGASQ